MEFAALRGSGGALDQFTGIVQILLDILEFHKPPISRIETISSPLTSRHHIQSKGGDPRKMAMKTNASIASFGGKLLKLSHEAKSTSCIMNCNLYLPPQAVSQGKKVPVLLYLSGLTCTGDNCAEKGFFQHAASQRGVAVVYPDTSPRGLGIQGEDDSYDFGSGAGFYVNATKEPWSKGYNMYDYVTEELPKSLFETFKELDTGRVSITGHSMGGHGALILVSSSCVLLSVSRMRAITDSSGSIGIVP